MFKISKSFQIKSDISTLVINRYIFSFVFSYMQSDHTAIPIRTMQANKKASQSSQVLRSQITI